MNKCPRCGGKITRKSIKIYGITGMCLSCNWHAYNYDASIKTDEDWNKKYIIKLKIKK